ncbi:LigA [Strigomonas culicis]|uniref:LigA n=1 Tax=Strigomonas culicis TaxID=28005 RepID=S9TKV5_9TRYP|nr:LigA [Strigomonas culicis]|eukprot:EPY17444.1 LigA [Strigomonas culicis]
MREVHERGGATGRLGRCRRRRRWRRRKPLHTRRGGRLPLLGRHRVQGVGRHGRRLRRGRAVVLRHGGERAVEERRERLWVVGGHLRRGEVLPLHKDLHAAPQGQRRVLTRVDAVRGAAALHHLPRQQEGHHQRRRVRGRAVERRRLLLLLLRPLGGAAAGGGRVLARRKVGQDTAALPLRLGEGARQILRAVVVDPKGVAVGRRGEPMVEGHERDGDRHAMRRSLADQQIVTERVALQKGRQRARRAAVARRAAGHAEERVPAVVVGGLELLEELIKQHLAVIPRLPRGRGRPRWRRGGEAAPVLAPQRVREGVLLQRAEQAPAGSDPQRGACRRRGRWMRQRRRGAPRRLREVLEQRRLSWVQHKVALPHLGRLGAVRARPAAGQHRVVTVRLRCLIRGGDRNGPRPAAPCVSHRQSEEACAARCSHEAVHGVVCSSACGRVREINNNLNEGKGKKG